METMSCLDLSTKFLYNNVDQHKINKTTLQRIVVRSALDGQIETLLGVWCAHEKGNIFIISRLVIVFYLLFPSVT